MSHVKDPLENAVLDDLLNNHAEWDITFKKDDRGRDVYVCHNRKVGIRLVASSAYSSDGFFGVAPSVTFGRVTFSREFTNKWFELMLLRFKERSKESVEQQKARDLGLLQKAFGLEVAL